MKRWLALMLLLPTASQAFTYNESVDGDLSGNREAPTALVAQVGSNTLSGTMGGGDIEYVRVTLPPGAQLSSLVFVSMVSTDDTAFIAVQAGPIFTVSPDEATEGDLLGYSHIGTGPLAGTADPGTDILDNIGQGPDSIGFVPPLTGTDYTFWIQQFNAQPFSFTFDFVVMPEPGTAALFAGAGLLALLGRLRKMARGTRPSRARR
jgi:hypothetical protein